MEPHLAQANLVQPDSLRAHGFTEPGSERVLRDLVQLASTFCASPVVLGLQDDTGLWFCAGVGLGVEELAELESCLGRTFGTEHDPVPLDGAGLALVEGVWLLDPGRRPHGCLCVVGAEPFELTAAQKAGLRHLAAQISALVLRTQEQAERRTASRGSAGASFVPGLVHELRNFIFGISASLDAFQARVGAEGARHSEVMRASLDRLNAFIEELREYGDPQGFTWEERDLEPLLGEVLEHHRPLAERLEVTVRLQVAGPLPRLRADQRSLRIAFIRLLDLAIQQERPGGVLMLQLGWRVQGRERVVFGHLDGAGLKLKNLELTRIFEPFYFRASGLGRLALPVARRIFEAHGGNLSANPGPEGGMRLGFMLPGL